MNRRKNCQIFCNLLRFFANAIARSRRGRNISNSANHYDSVRLIMLYTIIWKPLSVNFCDFLRSVAIKTVKDTSFL